jgi:hypothetical protein
LRLLRVREDKLTAPGHKFVIMTRLGRGFACRQVRQTAETSISWQLKQRAPSEGGGLQCNKPIAGRVA